MATQNIAYSSQTSITITLASLATAAARQSTVVDNTSNLYLDALVTVQVIFANTALSADQVAYVYAYGGDQGGSPIYTGGATGSDGSYTMTSPTPLKLIGIIPAVQNATVTAGPFSVATGFGGQLPSKWGIVVYDNAGPAFTAGTNTATFYGITGTVA